MNKTLKKLLQGMVVTGLLLVGNPGVASDLDEKARQLAQQYLLVDTHIDVPYRLEAGG